METRPIPNPVSTWSNTSGSIPQPLKSTAAAEKQPPVQDSPRTEASRPSGDQPESPQEILSAAKQIEKFVSTVAENLQFNLDEDSGRVVVRLVDNETKEVIRQIPSQEVLDIAKALDKLQGLLISRKA